MHINIIRLRGDNILELIMDELIDLGIIEENILEEELFKRKTQCRKI